MTKFPELCTAPLRLRCIQLKDTFRLLEYCNDHEVSNNLVSLPSPYLEEDAISWMNSIHKGFKTNQQYVFVIANEQSDEMIGAIGLHLENPQQHAEIGFWIGKPHRNKGYASKVIRIVLKFGFEELQLTKIYAVHFTDNKASNRVLIKNGLREEAELKDHYARENGTRDVIQCAIFKEAYKSHEKCETDAPGAPNESMSLPF